MKKKKENTLKVNKNKYWELRKILKKRQKMIKISQIISILMSEKISVTRINKGFSQKYVKVVYPLKLGIKNINNHCKNAMVIFFIIWK